MVAKPMKRRQLLRYSLVLLAGCTAARNNPIGTAFNSTSGNFSEQLRFTVTDIQDFEKLQQDYRALQTVLAEILHKSIELVAFESYMATAAALQLAQVELALTGASEYVVIHARTNAVPVIGITRPNYRSIICVSENSKIKSIAQLKGKTIAMWKVGSTSGHLGVTKLLMDAGLDPKSDLKIMMLGSLGLPALQKGEVDAWGGSSTRYAEFLLNSGLSEKVLPPIAKGQQLPCDLLVASSQLDSISIKEVHERLIKNSDRLIQSLSSVEQGKYKKANLVQVNNSDYDTIRHVYKALGQGDFIP
jgi:phosphonate transport system substrate-binding protein